MNCLIILATTVLILSPICVSASERDTKAGGPANCTDAMTDEPSLIDQLVRLAIQSPNGRQYKKIFVSAQETLKMTEADLQEAVDLQILLFRSQESGDAIKSIPVDKITAADRKDVEKAYNYARTYVVGMQGALMKAIKERQADVVRGLLTMSRQQELVCSIRHPGVSSFCKNLDLNQGWKGQNYLVEASNTSRNIALFLIQNGAKASPQDLANTAHGTEVMLGLIEAGLPPSYSEALLFQDDRITLKLLDLERPFSIKDLGLAITHNRRAIFEEAIRRNPKLAEKITVEMLNETIVSGQMTFFERILELRPALAMQEKSGHELPIETASLVNNVPAARALIEKYKVMKPNPTDTKSNFDQHNEDSVWDEDEVSDEDEDEDKVQKYLIKLKRDGRNEDVNYVQGHLDLFDRERRNSDDEEDIADLYSDIIRYIQKSLDQDFDYEKYDEDEDWDEDDENVYSFIGRQIQRRIKQLKEARDDDGLTRASGQATIQSRQKSREYMKSKALYYSARHPDAVILKLLLAEDRIDVNQVFDKRNALLVAIEVYCSPRSDYSKETIVELILAGANVNAEIKSTLDFRLNRDNPEEKSNVKGSWTALKVVNHYLENTTFGPDSHTEKATFKKALNELKEILEDNDAK